MTAARLWRLRRGDGPIHIVLPRHRAGHPGLRVHRPRLFSPDDIVEHEGIAVTSVGRTLLDLAATERLDRISWTLHEAGVQGVLDAQEVWAVLARHPSHRGARRLEAALSAEFAPTRSGLERAYLEICEAAGVPRPKVNVHLRTSAGLEEVDFHWPRRGLVVEVDGARYHSSRWRRARDAEKDQRLRAAGHVVRRFSELEISLDSAVVGRETAALYRSG